MILNNSKDVPQHAKLSPHSSASHTFFYLLESFHHCLHLTSPYSSLRSQLNCCDFFQSSLCSIDCFSFAPSKCFTAPPLYQLVHRTTVLKFLLVYILSSEIVHPWHTEIAIATDIRKSQVEHDKKRPVLSICSFILLHHTRRCSQNK